jgi:hypothetical protein
MNDSPPDANPTDAANLKQREPLHDLLYPSLFSPPSLPPPAFGSDQSDLSPKGHQNPTSSTVTARKLLGYVLRKWKNGEVIAQNEYEPTTKGKRAAERVKRSFKTKKPGRKGQSVTIMAMYESGEGD